MARQTLAEVVEGARAARLDADLKHRILTALIGQRLDADETFNTLAGGHYRVLLAGAACPDGGALALAYVSRRGTTALSVYRAAEFFGEGHPVETWRAWSDGDPLAQLTIAQVRERWLAITARPAQREAVQS